MLEAAAPRSDNDGGVEIGGSDTRAEPVPPATSATNSASAAMRPMHSLSDGFRPDLSQPIGGSCGNAGSDAVGARARRCCCQSIRITWIAPATGIAPSAPRMPASSAPISTDDQHDERRELHRPAVDHRLEEVVLDLLVDDEEDDDDDPGRDRVQERDRADRRSPAIVAPASGIRSRIATITPERDRVRDAQREQDDGRQRAGDQADQRGCRSRSRRPSGRRRGRPRASAAASRSGSSP